MEVDLGRNNFIKVGVENHLVALRVPVDDQFDAQFILTVEQATLIANNILQACEKVKKEVTQ